MHLNKFQLKLSFIIITGLILPVFAFAILDPNTISSVLEIIQRIYNFLLMLGVPICVVIIIWGAFKLMTSGGDPIKAGESKKILTWAIIGLVILLLSNGLVSVLGDVLGTKISEIPK